MLSPSRPSIAPWELLYRKGRIMGRGAEKEKLAIQLRYISRGQERKEGVPDFASPFKEGILGNAVCRPYLL